jgi:copper oxidase (laccase) domain-containing protein
MAWLGPTIGQANFEVGDDVRTAFMSGDVQAASAFEANSRGRWQCDLYALARRRLALLGISAIFGGAGGSVGGGGAGGGAGDRAGGGDAWCTYADAARYFSFRRDGQCGRMAALIWLE